METIFHTKNNLLQLTIIHSGPKKTVQILYAHIFLSYQFFKIINTGCLIKNVSTHNFFIYYPISMNKKNKDMVFHALQTAINYIFLVLSSIANDSQLFFLMGTCSFFRFILVRFFFSESNDVLKVIIWSIAK
jgi:hypothetical protein